MGLPKPGWVKLNRFRAVLEDSSHPCTNEDLLQRQSVSMAHLI